MSMLVVRARPIHLQTVRTLECESLTVLSVFAQNVVDVPMGAG
jgi:hypothetical protein